MTLNRGDGRRSLTALAFATHSLVYFSSCALGVRVGNVAFTQLWGRFDDSTLDGLRARALRGFFARVPTHRQRWR